MTTLIASIDVGFKNFALCVEALKSNEVRALSTLDSVYKAGQIVLLEKINFNHRVKYIDISLLLKITAYLDQLHFLLSRCALILIEKQMGINKKAQHIEHHITSYLIAKYTKSISNGALQIQIVPAKNKTQILGSQLNRQQVKQKQHKKWVWEVVQYILHLRKDTIHYNMILSAKKKDDYCDTICQLQAVKYKYLTRHELKSNFQADLNINEQYQSFVQDFYGGKILCSSDTRSLCRCRKGHQFVMDNRYFCKISLYRHWCNRCR